MHLVVPSNAFGGENRVELRGKGDFGTSVPQRSFRNARLSVSPQYQSMNNAREIFLKARLRYAHISFYLCPLARTQSHVPIEE